MTGTSVHIIEMRVRMGAARDSGQAANIEVVIA
jgi:hypothetical protein